LVSIGLGSGGSAARVGGGAKGGVSEESERGKAERDKKQIKEKT